MHRSSALIVTLVLLAALPGMPGAQPVPPQFTPPATVGDEGDVITRLMKEPLTLFDWGLSQLDRDMARVSARLYPEGRGTQSPRHGAIYDWRNRQIVLYLSIPSMRDLRTPAACRDLFERSIAELTIGAPAGPDAAGWYLLNAFKPKGHFWGGRFEDIGGKLVRNVRLEVLLLPQSYEAAAGDALRVKCSGPLNAGPEEIAFEMSS